MMIKLPQPTRSSYLLYVIVFALFVLTVDGLKHNLKITNDNRRHFYIENFGFEANGELYMSVKNWKFNGVPWVPIDEEDKQRAGFLIKITDTDSTAFLEENSDKFCLWDEVDYDDPKVKRVLIDTAELTESHILVDAGQEGFYNIYFINCEKDGTRTAPVSFELQLEMWNEDFWGTRSYLSAGLSPLPTMYAVFTGFFAVLLIVWLVRFMRGEGKKINRVHHLMSLLVTLKILSLFFEAIEYHYTKTTGGPGGWAWAYYIFATLKTTFFFVIIALIGTGWSFVKPFLSEKDKKIFMVVIPLQILDNIALVIIEETAPGSQAWFTWKDIFRLVDIICCGAILIPIIWSMKHLREAAQIDGKAAKNLEKLKLFRQFYLIVVSYIYFTRIIIYLLDATLPFRLAWLGFFFTEMASLCFYATVGYKFRPVADNPYFQLELDEDTEGVRMGDITQRD